MNRNLKISFAFALFSSFCFSVTALEATVVSVAGKVEIQEGSIWAPVAEGDVLEKGTVISTGFKSEAVLSVKGTNFTLGPLTRITIEDMVSLEDKDNTQLYIDSGSLKADVGSSDGKRVGFKVRSAVATASVRGTEFKITSSGKLSVSSGLVSFGKSEASSPVVNTESTDYVPAEEDSAADASADASASGGVSSDAGETASSDTSETAAATPKSTPFTSSSEVGDSGGVPVFAGQTSVAAVSGSRPSQPAAEKAVAASGGVSSTTGSVSMASIASPAVASSSSSSSSAASVPTTGSVSISVNFKD